MICIRNSRSLRPIVSPRSSVIIANRPAPKPLTPFTQKRGIIFQPTLIQVPGGKTVELASWFANLTARMIQQRPAILGRYSVAPVDLFRVNSGKKVKLRDYAAQTQSGRGLYDLHVKGDGLVHPAFGDNFEGVYCFHASLEGCLAIPSHWKRLRPSASWFDSSLLNKRHDDRFLYYRPQWRFLSAIYA